MSNEDVYSRFDYRRLIAWPERIERERPLLDWLLDQAPVKRALDVGSGTGEHARYIHSRGFEVTGIDASPKMIASSVEGGLPDGLRFVEGDLRELGASVEGVFGAAICLGNTLPHVQSDDELRSFARGLAAHLAPGAHAVVQIINYERIVRRGERTLPVNVRPDPDGGEIVFLRVIRPLPDGMILFFPSTLRLREDADPPLEVVSSRKVLLRGWRRDDLLGILAESGLEEAAVYGAFDRSPFDPDSSPDLIVVVRRSDS
jgi:glycine/sarcosine N-methyltransferase